MRPAARIVFKSRSNLLPVVEYNDRTGSLGVQVGHRTAYTLPRCRGSQELNGSHATGHFNCFNLKLLVGSDQNPKLERRYKKKHCNVAPYLDHPRFDSQ